MINNNNKMIVLPIDILCHIMKYSNSASHLFMLASQLNQEIRMALLAGYSEFWREMIHVHFGQQLYQHLMHTLCEYEHHTTAATATTTATTIITATRCTCRIRNSSRHHSDVNSCYSHVIPLSLYGTNMQSYAFSLLLWNDWCTLHEMYGVRQWLSEPKNYKQWKVMNTETKKQYFTSSSSSSSSSMINVDIVGSMQSGRMNLMNRIATRKFISYPSSSETRHKSTIVWKFRDRKLSEICYRYNLRKTRHPTLYEPVEWWQYRRFRDSDVILLCYSIANRKEFENIRNHLQDLIQFIYRAKLCDSDCEPMCAGSNKQQRSFIPVANKNDNKYSSVVPIILVGTMSDLSEEREVNVYEGYNLAKTFNMLFLEVSSRCNTNMNELAKMIKKVSLLEPRKRESNILYPQIPERLPERDEKRTRRSKKKKRQSCTIQ